LKVDLILLLLRLAFGGMLLFSHGLPKLLTFSERSQTFADPLGVGSTLSLVLAIFAEVFCSAGVILGVLTRWASVPVIITMLTLVFIVHAEDPWQKKELALCYLVPFLCLFIAGGGRFAVDNFFGSPSSPST
jgi:putative oxidoreductase